MSEVDSRVRRVTWALLGVAIGGLIGSVLLSAAVVAQIRDTQVSNTERSKADSETLALVKDCTQPGGDCFKRSQQRTAEAVGDINRVIIAAAACASGPEPRSVEDIAACVTKRLAEPAP